jgi:hypothetical protein
MASIRFIFKLRLQNTLVAARSFLSASFVVDQCFNSAVAAALRFDTCVCASTIVLAPRARLAPCGGGTPTTLTPRGALDVVACTRPKIVAPCACVALASRRVAGHSPATVFRRAADDATSRLEVCCPTHRPTACFVVVVVHDAVVCAHRRVDDGADAAANVLASVERMTTPTARVDARQ